MGLAIDVQQDWPSDPGLPAAVSHTDEDVVDAGLEHFRLAVPGLGQTVGPREGTRRLHRRRGVVK